MRHFMCQGDDCENRDGPYYITADNEDVCICPMCGNPMNEVADPTKEGANGIRP